MRCHGNNILFQKREKHSISKAIQIKFGIHVGLEVKMCKTVFQQWWKFVAMVTAYYAKYCGEKSISNEIWHMKYGTYVGLKV